MADSKKPEELNEDELGDVAGGYEMEKILITSYNLGGSGSDDASIKPRLTDAEIRARKDSQIGIRARTIEGTRIRK